MNQKPVIRHIHGSESLRISVNLLVSYYIAIICGHIIIMIKVGINRPLIIGYKKNVIKEKRNLKNISLNYILIF